MSYPTYEQQVVVGHLYGTLLVSSPENSHLQISPCAELP
jgi:hypothetical protein